ncbi:CDP-alcohol phosphatidyltransferase [Pandoraea pulmonicola]|uniref:CDP-alcohol phosphatidyltransferase n=2 Tax=Pandoraea pulmonicola TaxID=93221 RepID=A0AAJ4Z9Y7_PANPU|nr:CDP-alcohol phosphatidyltransferase [Pandoraea pulmonicola]
MPPRPRQYDARLARWLVTPLVDTRVSPNHLTTLRLIVGLACTWAFAQGGYAMANLGAVLLVLSNFIDHTDGELARISGKTSRFGHLYDLASDALVTVLLFGGIGMGVETLAPGQFLLPVPLSASALGWIAGVAVALIFFLRMRIEDRVGKAGTKQASVGGFETEDVLYLMPLVTLFDGTRGFLIAAAIGAPLFALLVIADYVRVMRRPLPGKAEAAPAAATAEPLAPLAPAAPAAFAVDAEIERALDAIDFDAVTREFKSQDAFIYLEKFLPQAVTEQLIAAARAVTPNVNRNYLPGHKQGGSVSRHTLDERAPYVAELYRSPALMRFLERLAGERLLPSPQDDPHAYALYYYTRPGDHIGWHYDTSYYKGRRYTLLLGVVDRSSCKLEYRLHTRNPGVTQVDGAVAYPPGALVFFDGDKLHHRITPLGDNEERISLTFEYVTDPRMGTWQRFISNMKDAIAYFGFRQVFRQVLGRTKR